jgi:hypothetical protein
MTEKNVTNVIRTEEMYDLMQTGSLGSESRLGREVVFPLCRHMVGEQQIILGCNEAVGMEVNNIM